MGNKQQGIVDNAKAPDMREMYDEECLALIDRYEEKTALARLSLSFILYQRR
jgi:hypothetical protein